MASASRVFDLVIFGASGFTGQYVVEEIGRTLEENKELRWAVAGRRMDKLQAVLAQASKQLGKHLEETPIILADVSDEQSIQDMCKETRLVLNCVGPYQLYGTPVVKACIEHSTHYIDLCGEPVFLENVQLLYNSKAQEAGCYIIGSGGWDSIPAEMGVIYTKQQFDQQFHGDVNHIESFLTMDTGPEGTHGNYGTWHSAVEGYTVRKQLGAIRKQLFTKPLPKGKHKMPRRPTVFYSKDVDNYCLPFVGADRSVVMRSERYNYENNRKRPIQFNVYTRAASIFAVIYMVLMGSVFGLFINFSFGRYLMKTFPRLMSLGMFSSEGPTRKQIEGASFTMTMVAHGFDSKVEDPDAHHDDEPNKRLVTKVSGPEIGYAATPLCMVQAAYVMLYETDKMPAGGGVFPPGAAFANTTLIDRLQKNNLHFSVVEK